MAKEHKMTTCKHCGAEIAASAKVCPQCGAKNKKPIYKKPWFIVLIIVILVAAIGSAGSNKTNAGNTAAPVTSANSSADKSESPAPEITYTTYDVSGLMDDLKNNALKASEKYKDQYVELTGRLNVIDSSGKYISIVPVNDEFAILGVQCYIKSEDQKNAILDMSVGDTLVVKGKITDVGEVMGYSLNIDEVSKA
jgi:RNA polymerase subunit RPABC4/transcription elongation factor Spt4/lysyl-tRNA synthetase class II